jgi:hypothetical protein
MKFKLLLAILISLGLVGQALPQQKDAFANVPAAQREKLKLRLAEFLEYHRTREWNKVYDLIGEQYKNANSEGLSREIFLKKKLYSTIRKFTPTSVYKLDDSHNWWMVSGCGTFDAGEPIESSVEAYLQDGDWYFSDVWAAPRCVDCTPKSCKH